MSLQKIVYLTKAQAEELFANGTITVGGVTVPYSQDDLYVTDSGDVTDVQVNGTSIVQNGIANVPIGNIDTVGATGIKANGGLDISNGLMRISYASEGQIKPATNVYRPIVPAYQHMSAFYGLAKASGDTTQSQSSNAVGNYTPEAKGSIQSMLGVTDLIGTDESSLVASKAYAVGEVFVANGKMYVATSAIAANDAIVPYEDGISAYNCTETNLSEKFVKNTDIANETTPGVIRTSSTYGTAMNGSQLQIVSAPDSHLKAGEGNWRPIVPRDEHKAVFYGLSKVAGVDLKDETVTLGTYPQASKEAIQSLIGVPGDVQVNGASVVTNGVANVPYGTNSVYGVVKGREGWGVGIQNGEIYVNEAATANIKNGTVSYKPIVPNHQHESVFYGLAKLAGADMASSSNAVGTYTPQAKNAIQSMLGVEPGVNFVEEITGTTATITGEANVRYVCGELTELTITPPNNGTIVVRFTSGTTPTVLSIPSTVKFPDWVDLSTLEASTTYEIMITDGVYGGVMTWAG